MEDIMIIEYLRKKGLLEDYVNHQSHPTKNEECADIYNKFFNDFKELTKNMKGRDKDEFIESLKNYQPEEVAYSNEHITEAHAKHIVSKMWSMDNSGRKWMGEKFDMYKAKEICDRYKGILPQTVTHADVYVAINAQFHDYHCLYKTWFGEDTNHQIVESAITYWFKDADYGKGCKIWNYFKES